MKIAKKIRCLLVIIVLIISAAACDSGLEVTSIEIAALPGRLEYPVGYSGAIDLSGGTVKRIITSGSTDIMDMQRFFDDITTDAVFTEPGEYTVTITLPNGASTAFSIWVIGEP